MSSLQHNTKTKIIESTRHIYLNEGIAEISMRKVAKHAGVSTMATYRHFESKEKLISAVIHEGFQVFQSYFLRALAEDSAVQRLYRCAEVYRKFAEENLKYYELMFMSSIQFEEVSIKHDIEKRVKSALQFLIDRVRDCQAEGLITDEDSKTIALHLWSHCHGLLSLHISGKLMSTDQFHGFYRESVRLALKGIDLKT